MDWYPLYNSLRIAAVSTILIFFLGILCAMEVYDIVFFDWVLLCHSNFFPHFYPELKGIVGPQQFGYNKASHLRHFALYLPASALAAWLCTLL